MQDTSNRSRFLSATLVLVLGTIPVVATVAGCGSGSGTAPAPLGTINNFGGRSFTSVITLAGNERGTLRVNVAANSTASGTLTIEDPTRSATTRLVLATPFVSGTVNPATGAFHLTGSYVNGAGQTVPIEITGTFPRAATGGGITLRLGTQTFTSTFTSSTSPSPTASPTATPTGGASPTPSPGASPTPTASPTATPSPSPTPTPTGDPNKNLVAKYFPLNTGDTYTYRDTTTSGPGAGTSTTRTERTGNEVTVDGVQVFRIENLDNQSRVTSVSFVRIDSTGFTTIGSDEVNPTTGAVTDSNRFNPPFTLPISILNNLSGTFSYTFSDVREGVTYSVTINGTATPQGEESVTVPAGTFNARKVRIQTTTTSTATGLGSFTSQGDSTVYLVENIGEVKAVTTATSTLPIIGTTTTSITTELLSGRVGTRNLP